MQSTVRTEIAAAAALLLPVADPDRGPWGCGYGRGDGDEGYGRR